jgi:integrase
MVLMMIRPHKDSRGVYHCRRKVPPDLRTLLGGEYKRSLHTKDPAEARRLFPAAHQLSEECFALARAQIAGSVQLSNSDVLQLASRWFRQELAKMEEAHDYSPYLHKEYIDALCSRTGQIIGEVFTDLGSVIPDDGDATFRAKYVVHVIVDVMTAHKLPTPAATTPLYLHLVDVFYDHLMMLSQHALARTNSRGLYEAIPAAVAPVAPLSVEAPKAKSTKLMSDVWASFKAAKLADGVDGVTPTTLNEYHGVVIRFIELFGDIPVTEVGRELVQEYRIALSKTPSKGDGIRGLNARQQIERAEAEGLPVLTASAARKRFKSLSVVLNHAVRQGWLAENPVSASGITAQLSRTAAKSKGARRRKEYSMDELRQIFSSPVYSSGWKPVRADLGEALWWLPLLAVYTGARLGEVAQLFVSDVRVTPEGINYLNLLKEEDDEDGSGADSRRVKTESSRRLVPLHDDLIALGFLDYVKSQPSTGQVFPRIKPSKVGKYAPAFGRIWRRYLSDTAKFESPAAPMHGFRHTFKTLCRTVGIPTDVSDWITGHAAENVGGTYGSNPLPRMAEELRKYPSIALEVGLLPRK